LNRNPFTLAEGDLVRHRFEWEAPTEELVEEQLLGIVGGFGIVAEVEHRYPRDMYGNGNCIEQEWARVVFPDTTIWINADYLERNPCKSSAVKV
jgi:hypothetical protein